MNVLKQTHSQNIWFVKKHEFEVYLLKKKLAKTKMPQHLEPLRQYEVFADGEI